MRNILLLIAAISLFSFPVAAGSTAEQSQLGFLSTSTTGSAACPSASLTPCFIPYSATNPMPISGGGGGSGTVTTVSCTTANGVSCVAANPTTTPALTFTLGAITPTTINGNTFTTGTGVLTLGAGKTFTVNNTLTLAGTDGSTLNIGTGGTLGAAAFIGTPVTTANGGTNYAYTGNSGLQNILGATAQLPKWNKALANVMSGKGNARIACVGDSTVEGFYSTNTASGPYAGLSFCGQLANILNGMGIPASTDNFMGDGSSDRTVADTRMVQGAGWSTTSGYFGGYSFIATSATSNLAYTPSKPVDTFVFWYPTLTGSGVLSYNIDGGSNTTVNQNATANYLKITTTAPLGFHTINFNYSSGAQAILNSVESYDSTKPQVLIENAGWSGSKAADWNPATVRPYTPQTACGLLGFDLVIIDLQINDMNTGTVLATYLSNLQALISACKSGGNTDVVIMTSNHINPANGNMVPEATQLTYANQLRSLAQTTSNSTSVAGVPLIDEFSNLVSFAFQNTTLGAVYTPSDPVLSLHLNYFGYGIMARDIAQVLMPVGGISGGYLSAITINGNTLTNGSGTLTLGAGKTLTSSNTLTFTGTDGSSVNFGTGGSVLYSGGAVASFSGDGTLISNSSSTGAVTATLANAAANTVWGNNTSGSAAPGYQTSISVSGTIASAAHTITSASAAAFSVGPNGSANPVVSVDGSTASSITGIIIKGAATGGITSITATDSGSNAGISVIGKGTGPITVTTNSTGQITLNGGGGVVLQRSGVPNFTDSGNNYSFSPSASTATGVRFSYVPAADTTLTASTNANVASFAGAGVIRQHSTGALTLQQDYVFSGTTDSFVGASALTDGATFTVTPKGCGTNGTCTNESAIYVPTLALVTTGSITNSYALNVSAATGATNNYAANLNGLVVLPAISSDATHTDAAVCEDTTTHALYSGSGTLGVCLGTSSERYKTNIVSISDGLKQIMALRPVNFNFNDKKYGDPKKLQYGFIAEEAVKVLPKLVSLDVNGKPNTFDYMGVVPVLVKAVQEQQVEIDQLKKAAHK